MALYSSATAVEQTAYEEQRAYNEMKTSGQEKLLLDVAECDAGVACGPLPGVLCTRLSALKEGKRASL